MGYWLKLYTDILEDRKYFELSEKAKLGMFEALLVCKRLENGELTGCLPSIDDIAFHTRKTVDEWKDILPELVNIGFIEIVEDKNIVKNYVKRQSAIPDSERSKQYRKRRNDGVMDGVTIESQNNHESVTERDGEYRIQNTDYRIQSTDLSLIDPLIKHFSDKSKLDIPDKKQFEFQAGWFEPMKTLIKLVNSDIDRAKKIINLSVDEADGKFSVSSPKSLLKTFKSEDARMKRQSNKSAGKEFIPEEVVSGTNS